MDVSWPDRMRDLDQLKAVEVTVDGNRYRLRTELVGAASAAFAAAGVRPPSVLTLVDDAASPSTMGSAITAPV